MDKLKHRFISHQEKEYDFRRQRNAREVLKKIFKKKLLYVFSLIVVQHFLWVPTACAEIVLPSALTTVEDEVFAGASSIKDIIIPDGIKEIKAFAFADMSLNSITIPDSIKTIDRNAFSGSSTPLLIKTVPDSAAVQFALSNNLDFRADTVFRALVIGQSTYPYPNSLSGPAKDIIKMRNLLSENYSVTVLENVSTDEIFSAVKKAFCDASAEDVSLFYYSGHGLSSTDPDRNGSLVGIDYSSYITANELRSVLDAIPGRKIVLIDACYSGSLIGKDAKAQANSSFADGENESVTIEDPAVSFIRAFSDKRISAAKGLATQQYFVMTSSSSLEKSWEAKYGGVFTDAFVESSMKGDLNKDGIITLCECHDYTSKAVLAAVIPSNLEQSVQVFPENCNWFGIFR